MYTVVLWWSKEFTAIPWGKGRPRAVSLYVYTYTVMNNPYVNNVWPLSFSWIETKICMSDIRGTKGKMYVLVFILIVGALRERDCMHVLLCSQIAGGGERECMHVLGHRVYVHMYCSIYSQVVGALQVYVCTYVLVYSQVIKIKHVHFWWACCHYAYFPWQLTTLNRNNTCTHIKLLSRPSMLVQQLCY